MEKLSPEKAWEILKRNGFDVTLEQATMVLEFLRKMSKIIVQDFRRKASNQRGIVKSNNN